MALFYAVTCMDEDSARAEDSAEQLFQTLFCNEI